MIFDYLKNEAIFAIFNLNTTKNSQSKKKISRPGSGTVPRKCKDQLSQSQGCW